MTIGLQLSPFSEEVDFQKFGKKHEKNVFFDLKMLSVLKFLRRVVLELFWEEKIIFFEIFHIFGHFWSILADFGPIFSHQAVLIIDWPICHFSENRVGFGCMCAL